jgi:hypothetical protein
MNLDSVDPGVPIDAEIAGAPRIAESSWANVSRAHRTPGSSTAFSASPYPIASHHSDASQAKEFISAGTLAAAIVHCRVVGVALGATANTT